MKRFYTLLFFSFGFLGCLYAQKDPAAKAILDKVSNTLKNSKGATANFSFSVKGRNGDAQGNTRGTIAISGNKYHIKEGNNEIISNGSQVWNFDKNSNEVNVSSASSDAGSINPDKLLSGSFSPQEFNYKLTSKSGNEYVVLLTPVDARKAFKQASLYINKSNNMITKASILDKSGSTSFFQLSNVKTGVNLPATLFAFNKAAHPGVEVID